MALARIILTALDEPEGMEDCSNCPRELPEGLPCAKGYSDPGFPDIFLGDEHVLRVMVAVVDVRKRATNSSTQSSFSGECSEVKCFGNILVGCGGVVYRLPERDPNRDWPPKADIFRTTRAGKLHFASIIVDYHVE